MSNPSLLCVPYRFKTSTLYSQIPDSGLGDFTVTRATTPTAGRATRVNAAGFIETVADNVPRLDYPLGGISAGCPALLVEPSAQNLVQRSEEFNNAFHFPFNLNAFGSGSVANTTATLDPYGTNLADYIQENSASSAQHSIIDIFAGNVSGTTYTWSVFAKAAERTIIQLANNGGGGGTANFNLTTGVATLSTGVSASMQNYGNGWWRCVLTYISNLTGNHNVQIRLCDASGNPSYNGTGNQGAYIFGAQLETGSVATSYIPTTTAAITRGAETVSKTGISSLIGQTEGTIYAEVDFRSFASSLQRRIISLRVDGSNVLSLEINTAGNQFDFVALSGGVGVTASASGITTGVYKIAVGYNSATNGTALYVNGTLRDTKTIAIPNLSAVVFGLGVRADGAAGTQLNDRIRAHAIYPTRLPNTGPLSLQSLTQ